MNDELNLDMLREEVNPVFLTAQSCLKICAQLGDEDSIKLMELLDFEEQHNASAMKVLTPEMLALVGKLMPGFHSLVEARFYTTNKMISDTGVRQVVDLPCGYTSRGIKLSKSGVKYYGFDLPAVAEAMGPAVKKIIGDAGNIQYAGVDATNYSSLREALSDADGELFITTEGMLMYLSQSEIEEVFRNIRRLLLEFGGKWVTIDNTLYDAQPVVLSKVVGSSASPDLLDKVGRIAAGAMSKTEHAKNKFFDKDRAVADAFVRDMGFDLEYINVGDYLPDVLHSLEGLPEESINAVRDTYKNVKLLVMTATTEKNEVFTREDKDFKADVRAIGDTLNIALSGRLDTITSPDLLALYKEASSKATIGSIVIDMKDLDYISSAGLRVLLIMRQDIDSGNDFSIININQNVMEILETTGFDGILT